MDKRFFYMLNMAQHKAYKYADKQCDQKLGVSVTQVACLLYLAKNDGCLLKDLSAALNLNNSAITGLSNRMSTNNLIEKKPCRMDGRATRLYLTPQGQQILKDAKPLMAALNDALLAGFTEDELDVVARFMNRIIHNM